MQSHVWSQFPNLQLAQVAANEDRLAESKHAREGPPTIKQKQKLRPGSRSKKHLGSIALGNDIREEDRIANASRATCSTRPTADDTPQEGADSAEDRESIGIGVLEA